MLDFLSCVCTYSRCSGGVGVRVGVGPSIEGHEVKWNPRTEKRQEPPKHTVDPSHLFTRGSGDVTHFTLRDNGGWKKATGRKGWWEERGGGGGEGGRGCRGA